MNRERYSSIKLVIPAPEIPPKINKGGNQHQLEATNAESNAPKLAKRSARPDPIAPFPLAADCDTLGSADQQSGAGADG